MKLALLLTAQFTKLRTLIVASGTLAKQKGAIVCEPQLLNFTDIANCTSAKWSIAVMKKLEKQNFVRFIYAMLGIVVTLGQTLYIAMTTPALIAGVIMEQKMVTDIVQYIFAWKETAQMNNAMIPYTVNHTRAKNLGASHQNQFQKLTVCTMPGILRIEKNRAKGDGYPSPFYYI